MSDCKKGLPIRTESDPDFYTRVKIFDDLVPTQTMEVDADKNAHVEVHGNKCDDSSDVALRLSELGDANTQGDYHADDNSCPASSAVVVHDRNATPNETHQNVRATGITSATVHAQDISLHDESGNPFSTTNPLPIEDVGTAGDPIHEFNEGVDIAAGATSTHDYSVANGNTFRLEQIVASSSSRAKWELQIGDGAASEVFATKAVWFSAEDSSDPSLSLSEAILVVGTVNTTTVRVIRTNRDDDDACSLYTTIVGSEES